MVRMDTKYEIFISYKRADKERVFKIKENIEKSTGKQCWIDLDGIESDAQFINVIMHAINNCSIFLFMYSQAHSAIKDYEHDWTVREISFAQTKKKRIVFINLDGSKLADWFVFMFGTKQQINSLDGNEMKHLYNDIVKWLASEEHKVATKHSILPKSGTGTTNNNALATNKENTLYLKIISDTDCHVLIDCEEKGTAKANILYKIPLNRGEYYVQFISCANNKDIVTEEICLERDTLHRVNLADVKNKREQVQQSVAQKSPVISNITSTSTTNYYVILKSSGPAKLQVVKCVKEVCGIGLNEAKDLVDYTPSYIAKNVQYNIAISLKKEIEQVGGIVEIIGPNSPCPCGSGKKFKFCHGR